MAKLSKVLYLWVEYVCKKRGLTYIEQKGHICGRLYACGKFSNPVFYRGWFYILGKIGLCVLASFMFVGVSRLVGLTTKIIIILYDCQHRKTKLPAQCLA